MPRSREPAPWVSFMSNGLSGTVHEVVLSQLRAVIIAGIAAPGAPINVDDVAERFQVSRIPVREALKILTAEGLVEHEPRGGYTVSQVTRNELAELYIVREALEREALRAAIGRATPADDLAAQQAYDQLTSSVDAHNGRGHQYGSKRFHFALVHACGMQRLLGMLEQVWNLTMPLQPMAYISSNAQHGLHDEHLDMLKAFHARDMDTLLEPSRAHYERVHVIVDDLPSRARLRPE